MWECENENQIRQIPSVFIRTFLLFNED